MSRQVTRSDSGRFQTLVMAWGQYIEDLRGRIGMEGKWIPRITDGLVDRTMEMSSRATDDTSPTTTPTHMHSTVDRLEDIRDFICIGGLRGG